jgi:diguanylate cyclase (GGDEF)-like protein
VETKRDAGTKIMTLTSVIVLMILVTGFFSIDRTEKIKDEFLRVAGEKNEQDPATARSSETVTRHARVMRNAVAAFTLFTFAVGVFLLLEIRKMVGERRDAMNRLEFMTIHDPLSGLFNRRHLLNQLEVSVAAAHRYDHPLSLCLCDLDDFKQVNDTRGLQAGDEVIRQFGQLIGKEIRVDDFAGRYGGDEFCIVLNHTPAGNAAEVIERIRSGLERLAFRDQRGGFFQVSATFGVSELDRDLPTKGVLIESADQALYQAKAEGRNRVVARHVPAACQP